MDRLVLLSDGAVAAEGPPSSVLSPELLARVYRIDALQGEQDNQPWMLPWSRRP
jgi:iron complex transport system ATP-binding protein